MLFPLTNSENKVQRKTKIQKVNDIDPDLHVDINV